MQVKTGNIKNNDYISNSKYSLDLDTLNKLNVTHIPTKILDSGTNTILLTDPAEVTNGPTIQIEVANGSRVTSSQSASTKLPLLTGNHRGAYLPSLKQSLIPLQPWLTDYDIVFTNKNAYIQEKSSQILLDSYE